MSLEVHRKRPRILFVINSLCGGGAERVMSTLLSHSEHEKARFEIHLALLDREPSAYRVPAWIKVHQLDSRFRLLRSVRQLRGLLAEIDPDCVISFLTRANVANCLVTPGRGKPAIISERINTDMHLGSGLRGSIAKWIVRIAYPRASRVIAVAMGVGEALVRNYGVARARIEVIPNPVDVHQILEQGAEECPDAPDGPFTFAMGRLVGNKNFQLLLRAFVRSDVPGALVIAGEGPERGALLQLAQELGIGDRLRLPGFLSNPYPLLSRARTFVLPSNAEGFPNALVEALGLGIPCIATNCADGPAEILAGLRREEIDGLFHGPFGIVVPVDDPEAMAHALRQMQDPRLRDGFSAAGRARAHGYSVENSVARYWRAIAQALAEHAGPA